MEIDRSRQRSFRNLNAETGGLNAEIANLNAEIAETAEVFLKIPAISAISALKPPVSALKLPLRRTRQTR